MKKFISIILICFIVLPLSACKKAPPTLDPRELKESVYSKNIRDLTKHYNNFYHLTFYRKKTFDYYLTYFLMKNFDILIQPNCAQKIDNDHEEFDLVYFMPKFKSDLKKFCNYSTQQLIKLGDEYADKNSTFDHYDIIALQLYYNAHRKSLWMLIEDEGNLTELEKLALESYQKFESIRQKLPDGYINLATYTPFDPNADEDF